MNQPEALMNDRALALIAAFTSTRTNASARHRLTTGTTNATEPARRASKRRNRRKGNR